MRQRGRKSAESLQTLEPAKVVAYARPPAGLRESSSDIWRAIVKEKPPEWFGAGTRPLLQSYCFLAVEAQRLQQILQSLRPNSMDPDDVEQFSNVYGKSMTQYVKASSTMLALAAGMRLTQQNAMTQGSAEKTLENSGPKPWEPEP